MFEGLYQPMHLLVILGLALLVFGPRKLPELGKGLGEAIRGFKNSINGGEAVPHSPATRAEDASGSLSPSASSEFQRPSRSR